ncbi:WYL domain-containing protein [Thiospirochaeta perfilievii]|uniref:WYL domain-containing protein n=1 Tax=Thiospirochaeta perfilievii TaxID=252967 RepID=A0A5C1QE30_9SPIO|nr:WYL domain-containing protein [Thiospirochaeta perfilievii]
MLFDKSQTLYISERNWAKEQKIEILDDGNLLLWLRTSGRHDIKRWVLSYGADAELLEPESLRKEIADELITMSKRYN